jgi:putative oxidoreductase
MSFVDIVFHKVDHTAIGMFFDSIPDSIILDQRLLWMLPLFYLILHGGGRISLDYWLGRIIRTQLFSPGI